MSVRFPSVAGTFYPAGERACREQVANHLATPAAPHLGSLVRGGVVPHAGWSYSGPTAGRVFATLSAQDPPETIVLFGAVHRWGVRGASMYGSGSWRTPLGDLSIDVELAQEVLLSTGGAILDSPDAHAGEHSIEVQLPFIAHLFPGTRILPIAVPPSPDAHKLGAQVASAARALGRRTLAIGTSDLTHYGPRYGLAPVGAGDQALEWVKKNDARLLDLTVQMRAADVVEEAREHQNACGAGAIAASIAHAGELGATRGIVLDYTTSHDVMPVGRAPPTWWVMPRSSLYEMSDREAVDRDTPQPVPPYAVVVVQTPLRRRVAPPSDVPPDTEESDYLTRAFHYSVPERIKTEICAGQLVWVPFGSRYLQGVIVGFDHQSPVEDTRDIDRIADPLPVLSPIRIELAHWLSRHYLAPIHRVIQAMLPPGVIQGVDVIVCPVADCQTTQTTEGQEQILSLLRQKGPLSLRQISRLTRLRNWRSIVDQLVEHGWATKHHEIRPPKAKPKLVAVVRAHPGLSPTDYPSRQAQKQRRALAYLLWRRRQHGGDEWMSRSEFAAEAGVSPTVVRALVDKGLVDLERRQVWRDPLQGRTFVPVIPPRLTPEQDQAWQTIAADLQNPGGRPFLLQGVTGSGKTEIYLRAAQHVLERGKGAIVLVPEIALTPQTIRRFGARFPTVLAVMHHRLSLGERFDQWRRLRAGELRLVIGPRSAIFAPMKRLGLIVLDEEHESSYKQDRTPHYHAREVAVRLAKLAGATCILGSATPALESAYRAERGAYQLLRLPKRVMGHRRMLEQQADQLHRVQRHYRPVEHDLPEALYAELPPVEIVDMRAELRAGNRGILSRSLKRGIEAALAAGEQIILFLNRRGAATFIMCRDCGHVLKCPRCEVPLTYHSDAHRIICHHCSYRTLAPSQCPNCWSNRIRYFGIGTQRVEQVVHRAYPNARIVRWDLDTTGSKRAHERILDRFVRGEADVMVGTQMIAKGLDLPKVTLVGVITADTLINLPDIRSSERTFQLLTQVAGRAGRSILGGKVIIQTYTPRHPAIQAASRHDYWAFYQQEMAFRRKHWYPPISRLIRLLYLDTSADKAQREAQDLHQILTLKIARLGLPEINLIGPAPSFFSRLRGKSRWQIVIRGTDPRVLLKDLRLPLGWRVDVDPVSLL